MTAWAFWILAAVMTAGAVAFLLRSLFNPRSTPAPGSFDGTVYRDQLRELERERAAGQIGVVEAEAARAEIGRRLLAVEGEATGGSAMPQPEAPPRRIAMGLAVILPLAALAIYLAEGTPSLPSQPFATRDQSERAAMQAAVAEAQALERRLATAPQDRDGWVELGRRWGALGNSAKAADAFGRALGLQGGDLSDGDATLTGEYGEALVGANSGTVTAAAQAAFERALQLRPGDPRARYFLGLGRFQAGDDKAALELWQGLMRDSPAYASWVPATRDRLSEVAKRLGLDSKTAIPEPKAAPSPGAMAAIATLPPEEQEKAIRGMVDGLAAKLEQSPDDLQGWIRLARARDVLGDKDAAADALARAVALAPADDSLVLDYADALLAAGRGDDTPPVLEAGLRRVLATAPDDLRALWFLGVAAQKGGQPDEARRLWGLMRDQFDVGSQERAAIEARIAQLSAPGAG